MSVDLVGSYSSETYINGAGSVAIQDNYAYVIGSNSSSLAIIDISDKANPIYSDSYISGTYIDGAGSVAIQDNYAYVTGYSSSSLAIIDISDYAEKTITLDRNLLFTRTNSEIQLNATTTPGEEIEWESDNILVADVDDDGLVVTIKKGQAIITASIADGAISATCTIKVGGDMDGQSSGLYSITAKDLDTNEELFLGNIPVGGTCQFVSNENTQMFFNQKTGNTPVEARVLMGVTTFTADLVSTTEKIQFLDTAIKNSSSTKTIIVMKNGCLKKTFEISAHPQCVTNGDKSQDIKLLKAVVDTVIEVTATPEGEKLFKCVFTALAQETTLETPAALTLASGSGAAEVLYFKAVATNDTGISDFSASLTSELIDDDITFPALGSGVTGYTLYAGTDAGITTGIKSWQLTTAEMAALKVEAVGTLYASGDMTTETALPSSVTGFFYKSVELGS